MTDDFLIRVRFDQRGVERYTRELSGLPERLKRIELNLRQAQLGGGVRPTASSDPLTRAIRRQVELTKKGQAAAQRGMARVAVETQQDVARRLVQGYKRPEASTGALEQFTLGARNRRTTNEFFGVGDVERMLRDRKVGYALAIEGGSDAAVRRRQRLTGYWAGGGGVRGFDRGRTKDRFVSTSASTARRVLEEAGRPDDPFRGLVRKPIQAERAYRKTAQYFRPQEKTADVIRKALGFR